MKNSLESAKHWVEFIARRPEFLPGQALLRQFENGHVSRLCPCGCNSFNFTLNAGVRLDPIAEAGEREQAAFILEFPTEAPEGTLEFILYATKEGNFGGLDVHFKGNSAAVPDGLTIKEPPFQVYGPLARIQEQ